ncbi:MAG: hypothetical protein D6832_03960 [Alphaproteobacteria bacterium]|nr:MAG: hypothetical protein D6832_03960 [Alphaproteobacteria bacterium]
MTSRSDKTGAAWREHTHLVLDGRARPVEASLYGRAIAARSAGRPLSLVPVHELSHVTVIGQVRLDAPMLAACAAAGRPVGITDSDGRLRALVVPTGVRRTPLGEALDRLARRSDWTDRLDDWRRSRISRIARGITPDPAAAARAGWAGAQALIVAAAGAGTRATAARLANIARTEACIIAAAALTEAGCPARWMRRAADPGRDLVPLFGQIALWRLARLTLRSRAAARLRAALRDDLERSGRPGARLARTAARVTAPLHRALLREADALHRWCLDMTGPAASWRLEDGAPL